MSKWQYIALSAMRSMVKFRTKNGIVRSLVTTECTVTGQMTVIQFRTQLKNWLKVYKNVKKTKAKKKNATKKNITYIFKHNISLESYFDYDTGRNTYARVMNIFNIYASAKWNGLKTKNIKKCIQKKYSTKKDNFSFLQ